MLDIDIIIPVYNKEQYISDLLDLLLSKSLLFGKIILVDDCSNDNSVNILKDYEKKYSDKIIVFLQPKNQGPHYARMKGVELSDKKFVMFVDADDLVDLNGLEIFLLSEINWSEFGICFGNTQKIYKQIDIQETSMVVGDDFFKILKNPVDLIKYSPTMSGIIIRRDVVSYMNIGNCSWGEDILFYVKSIQKTPFLYKNVKIGIYRIMEGTRGTSGGTFSKRLLFLKALFLELNKKSLLNFFFFVFVSAKILLAWLIKKIK